MPSPTKTGLLIRVKDHYNFSKVTPEYLYAQSIQPDEYGLAESDITIRFNHPAQFHEKD